MSSAMPRWVRSIGAAAAAVVTAGLLAIPLGAPAAATTLPYGPDVSGWQHPSGAAIDWTKVKAAGNSFAIIKATESTSYTNPYYAGDIAAARRAGLIVGTYHYARPKLPISTAVDQAKYFVQQAGGAGNFTQTKTLPPILDLEEDGGLSAGDLVTWAQTWLETVRQLTGRTPIVYTYPYFWPDQMGDTHALVAYPLWLAGYSSSAPDPIGGWPTWTLWQYSATSTVSGITTTDKVDMSRFNGTLSALTAFADGTRTTSWTVSRPALATSVTGTPGVSSVTVSWVPGNDGGQVPSSYTITSSDGTVKTVAGTTTHVVFSGLSTHVSYTFRVQATNSAGTSSYSAASSPVQPGTAPSVPANVSAVPGDGQVRISWSASTNSPTSYTLYRCSPAPCTATTKYTTLTGTTFLNTLVTDGTSYGYAVSATNQFGPSAPSATVYATPLGVPSAPVGLTATASTDGVQLTWSAPTSDGGSPVTGYTLTVDGAQQSLDAAATSYLVAGLSPGTHTITLAAVNAVGTGKAASAGVGTTSGAPASPSGLTAAPTPDGAVLTWGPPSSDGGSPVTSYLVSVDGAIVATLDATATTYTATGLSATTHTFGVAAVNALGTGLAATVQAAPAIPVTRTAGVDRYATANSLFQLSGSCNSVAVLARGDDFPDALAASYLASVEGAGTTPQADSPDGTAILLTRPTALPDSTLELMRRQGVSKVYVVGGPAAVSSSIVAKLEATRPYRCGTSAPTTLGAPMQVVRLGGDNRYDTAAKVAEYVGAGHVGAAAYTSTSAERTAILATGQNFPDAVSAGPAAYWHQFPLLLTQSTRLSSAARTALTQLQIKQVVLVGGTGAVSASVEKSVRALGISTVRAAGSDRMATAAAVAKLMFHNKATTLARGDDFADALAAAPLVGKSDSGLLLTASPTVLGSSTQQFLQNASVPITHLWVIGGTGAVSDAVVKQASRAIIGG